MTNRRSKSPGSFQDELSGVIERVAPQERIAPAKPGEPCKPVVKDTGELNDRLFEQAWKKSNA
jgi:hypothetical protein